MCLVELLVGPHVHEEGAVAALLFDLARSERQQLDAGRHQGALVEFDDRLEVRRLRPEAREGSFDELVFVVDREGRVVAAFVADRRGDLHVHPGAATHRSAEVTGPDLHLVAEAEKLSVQRAEDAARALFFLDREVGPRDVIDEEGVAGQDSPRLVRARRVDQRKRRVLGTVTGSVERSHRHVPKPELISVAERLVGVGGFGGLVDSDRGPGRRGKPAMARNVIGVVVGLEDVLDAHTHVAGEL